MVLLNHPFFYILSYKGFKMPIISDGNNQTGDELTDKHTTIGQVEHTGSLSLIHI